MKAVHFLGEQITIGESQGFIGLPIKRGHERTEIIVNQMTEIYDAPTIQTVWLPTNQELKLLNMGQPITLTIWGSKHPPVRMEVRTDMVALEPRPFT
jgi:hypothetical protein